MFSIFESKVRLSELTQFGITDIHSHFLPALDDGSPDVETSINLIKQAQNLGFKEFIFTPHIIENVWNNNANTIFEAENNLRNNLNFGLNFSSAAEYMIDHDFIEKMNSKNILCLKDNYILIEFSFSSMPNFAFDVIYELQIQGYIPILAHPERYLYLQNKFEIYRKLKKNGCLFQLNLLALTNYYGSSVNKIAQNLINHRMYDFVGSDTHTQRHLDYYKKTIKKKNIPYLKDVIQKNNEVFSFSKTLEFI